MGALFCIYLSQKRIYNSYRERIKGDADKEILTNFIINIFAILKDIEHIVLFRFIIYPIRNWLIIKACGDEGHVICEHISDNDEDSSTDLIFRKTRIKDTIITNFLHWPQRTEQTVIKNTIIANFLHWLKKSGINFLHRWPKVGRRIPVKIRNIDMSEIKYGDKFKLRNMERYKRFGVIADGEKLILEIPDETLDEILELATQVYNGMSDKDMDEIEQIALNRDRERKL